MKLQTEVLVIGGGATGAGIARDLALRGIPVVLVEKGDYASGASGRNQGLLHSGGRYVVNDPESARECIRENAILRRIAPHCLEETGGLFVSLPEDGLEFQKRFLEGCLAAGIPARNLSAAEAREIEPELNPSLLGAVAVPDGAVDPFALVMENIRDACARGAKCLSHTEACELLTKDGWVKGARARGLIDKEDYTISASFVVNATGAWANRLLGPAGLSIPMAMSKGSMLITNRRISHRIINRLRPPGDGDIVVPNDTVSILGTTSIRSEDPDHSEATTREVSFLIRELARLLPVIKETRITRAYAGIRPLLQTGADHGDRSLSRGFALIDHGQRDRLENLVSIVGGKLITYRLMAEKVVDHISEKLGLAGSATTHLIPLPGAQGRHGLKERLKGLAAAAGAAGEILCECELVTREEIEGVLKGERLPDIQDILHRTRLAKGTCQGGFCVYRLLGVLHRLNLAPDDSNEILKGFLEERWKGTWPVLWGAALREGELIESIYKGLFQLSGEGRV